MDPTQSPTQQPIQTPPEVFIPQPKPNYLKTIILSVLVIITLSLITYLIFQNQKLQKQSVNQQVSPTIQVPSPTSKPSTSISISSDETTDWKTYTSELGFSFKYPSDWSQLLKCRFGASDFGDICVKSNDFKEKMVSMGSSGAYYGVSKGGLFGISQRQIENATVENFCTPKETKTDSCKATTINGQPAMEIVIFNHVTDNIFTLGPKQFQGITGKSFNESYIISMNYPVNDTTNKVLLNQILSTFKFTNNTGVCIPTYQVETNSAELTAKQNYSMRCKEQRSEKDCLSIDLYNQKADDFSIPDEIPDCIWKNPIK